MIKSSISWKGGYLNISESEWESAKRLDKTQVKMAIHEFVERESVPLPYRVIDVHAARDSFDKLRSEPLEMKSDCGDCFSRYEYSWWREPKLVIPISTVGGIAADFFHQESRWKCDSINAPSPYRSWKFRKFRDGVLNALWTLKVKRVDRATLRQCIALRKYIAAQFRPSAAAMMYNHFAAKDVLDFSSGWGDRLCGFWASGAESYTGIDPNESLVEGYNSQIAHYKQWAGASKLAKMLAARAEGTIFPADSFDFVFTSPPYFNIERYTQEDSQSWKAYKKLDVWLNEFLFKAISNAWGALRKGGYLAVNIADVYSGHKINKICDPMNDFITTLPDSEFWGIIGYQMAKRPNSKSQRDGVFVEPIWVWRKK